MYEYQVKKLNQWFTQEEVQIGQIFRLFPDDVWNGASKMPELFYVLERKSGKKVGYFKPIGYSRTVDGFGQEEVIPEVGISGRGDVLRGELDVVDNGYEKSGRYYETKFGILLPYDRSSFPVLVQSYKGFNW